MKHALELLNHMVIWFLVMLFCNTALQSPMQLFLYGLASAFVAGVCYFWRLKVDKMSLFLLWHVVMLVLSFYVVGIFLRDGACAAVLIFSILYSCLIRFFAATAWLENPGRAYVIIAVLTYVVHWLYASLPYVKSWATIGIVLCFLCFVLYDSVVSIDKFVDMKSNAMKINTARVKGVSKKMSIIYVGTLGVLLSIFGLVKMDKVWDFLLWVGDKIMRFLAGFIPEGEPPMPESEKEPIESGMGDLFAELGKESPFMQKIGEGVAAIGGILIALVAIVFLIQGAIAIYRYFKNRQRDEEEILISEKLYEGNEKSGLGLGRLFQRLQLSPAQRIRKLYRRNMNKLDNKHVCKFPYMNPEEQTGTLSAYEVEKETREEIRELYEKARYSKEKVTEADVKRMHTII